MKTIISRRLLSVTGFFGLLAGFLGPGCSHAPVAQPYSSIVVDQSHPDHIVIQLNGDSQGTCNPGASASNPHSEAKVTEYRMPSSIAQDGKTYYFSSDEERERFLQAHDINSRY